MRRALTTNEFIQKAISTHGSRYNYSLTKYINSYTKVKIICDIHGEFLQTPNRHLNSSGCLKCSIKDQAEKKVLSTSEFIKKAISKHGDKYDYSFVEYVRNKSKVKIFCFDHGVFLQTPTSHLEGHACPSCYVGGYSRSKWIEYCDSNPASNPIVYIIRCYNSSEEFVKIGITSKGTHKRFSDSNSMPYSYEVLKEIKGSADFVFDKEKYLHKLYKDFKYKPLISFNGQTECFSLQVLDSLFD